MLRAKLSAVPALLLAAGLTLLAGCASTSDDKTANWSPNRIYAEAKDEMAANAYEKAIQLYEKLEGRAAGTPLAQQAQVEKAYAQWRAGDAAEAIATLDRFMRLHPASPGVDYALYLKGLVNFNDNLGLFSWIARQDLSERDQKAAKESFEAFKDLVTRFPQSKYAPDAQARLVYIVNSLAQYEVHVARYYYSRGAYVAAISRAQAAVSEYQNVPAVEEALALLVKSYEALKLTQLADDTRRVLAASFPASVHLGGPGAVTAPKDPWWKLW
ncbi:outer membrane protein assembly factor BamD [Ramlibacter sp. MAHUQ-53]|uniref:outer membrane protein assembly factor BamD n=1 Tax=unclassified Ramlibacter TaxID=2617605 RepID=UPI003645377B